MPLARWWSSLSPSWLFACSSLFFTFILQSFVVVVQSVSNTIHKQCLSTPLRDRGTRKATLYVLSSPESPLLPYLGTDEARRQQVKVDHTPPSPPPLPLWSPSLPPHCSRLLFFPVPPISLPPTPPPCALCLLRPCIPLAKTSFVRFLAYALAFSSERMESRKDCFSTRAVWLLEVARVLGARTWPICGRERRA